MLVIKPIENKETQKNMVKACGRKYLPSALAYVAYDCEDDGETVRFPIGVCQFTLKGGAGILDTLLPFPGVVDDEALMIMARACTSFLFRCGFSTAILTEGAAPAHLVTPLEFLKQPDGTAVFDVQKYYTSPCHGESCQ